MNFFGKGNKKEYVAAIILRDGDGHVYLLETIEASRSLKCIDQKAFTFTNGWDNLTYDIDELLFNLENDNKIEVKNAAFFIYSHFVDLSTREISAHYEELLKKIVEDNELNTLGYLEMDQIISKYYTSLEKSPLTAIIVEIDAPAVSIFIYQAGELLFSDSASRSENIISDLEDLFQRTSKDTQLPARFIMYDSEGIQEVASKVISHKWSKEEFPHVPKVDVVNESDVTNAILFISPEYVFASDHQTLSESEITETPIMQAEIVQEAAPESVPEDLGFIIGADVKKTHLPEPAGSDIYENVYQTQPSTSAPFSIGAITKNFHIPRIPMLPSLRSKSLIIVFVIVILLLSSLAAGLFYAHSANLTVYYDKSEISKTVAYDNADFIEKKTEKIDVKASIDTTGTKQIGEKAKGSITIFNATESDKTFKKGSTVSTSNKQAFILSSDVTVKAATKTVTSGGDILTTTSKEKVDVVASEIGPKYNIAKDSKLTFEGSSDTTYFAKSIDAFTGGTEKEIQTASKEDFTRIKTEIEKEINKKKAEALKADADNHKVLDQLTEIKFVKENYSKEVAEEAKSIDASVSAEVTYYLYDDPVVKKALIAKLSDEVPPHYVLDPENISFTVSSSEKKDDSINVELNVKGEPTYNIDQKSLIALIKGAPTASVEKILKEKSDSKGFAIEVVSPIPFFKFFTPLFDKNYHITTEPLN